MCRNARPQVGAIEEENTDQQQQQQQDQQQQHQQQIPPSNQQSISQAGAVKQKIQQNCAVQQKTNSLPCPQQNNTAVQFDLQLPTQTAEVQFAGRFLDSDSENEYNLLAVEAVESNTGVIDCPADDTEEYSGVVEVNHLNEASDRNGDLKTLDAILRAGNTFIKVLVDTGSPSSFLNRDTANTILRDAKANAKFVKFADLQLDTLYLDYNKQRILILGALHVSVTSIDWSVQNARFLVVEDNRCLIGLDLQPKLGIFPNKFPEAA